MKFEVVAQHFKKIEDTTKRLKMLDFLSELFKESPDKDIDKLIYICQENVLPAFKGVDIGMAEKMLEKAISRATGAALKRVKELYKKEGDLGLVVEMLAKKRPQRLKEPEPLTMLDVYDGFMKTAKASGTGSTEEKIKYITNLLSRAKPSEARYIARFVIGKLRLGIGDPTLMDALSKAKIGDKSLREDIERAYNLCSDLGLVAKTFFKKGEKGLNEFKIKPGNPVRMALAERMSSAENIIEKIGKCALEAKYDGFRLQCHKIGDKVELFSRNQERMTHMFPDIVKSVKKYVKSKNAIIEGEALVYDEATGELKPFQVTITRKRKYDIKEKSKSLPLKLFVFDLLYADGKDFTPKPYSERLKAIKKYIKQGEALEYAKKIITDDPEEVEDFFETVVTAGLEGVMAKRLDAPYSAGSRNFDWIKLKRSYKGELNDTVDVVIIGYLKGRGARAKFGIGAVLGAVYNKKKDMFESICKVGSGFSEENWVKLRKELDKIKKKKKPARVVSELEPDVWIEPVHVIEVAADEITTSPLHAAGKKDAEDSGYALRFPRAKGFIRQDKKAEDATTVKEIEKMYKNQMKK